MGGLVRGVFRMVVYAFRNPEEVAVWVGVVVALVALGVTIHVVASARPRRTTDTADASSGR